MMVIRTEIHKMLVMSEMQTGKSLIRLLLWKQSDLGLHDFERQLVFKILEHS